MNTKRFAAIAALSVLVSSTSGCGAVVGLGLAAGKAGQAHGQPTTTPTLPTASATSSGPRPTVPDTMSTPYDPASSTLPAVPDVSATAVDPVAPPMPAQPGAASDLPSDSPNDDEPIALEEQAPASVVVVAGRRVPDRPYLATPPRAGWVHTTVGVNGMDKFTNSKTGCVVMTYGDDDPGTGNDLEASREVVLQARHDLIADGTQRIVTQSPETTFVVPRNAGRSVIFAGRKLTVVSSTDGRQRNVILLGRRFAGDRRALVAVAACPKDVVKQNPAAVKQALAPVHLASEALPR